MKPFSEKVREERRRLRLSQKELGLRIGVSTRAVAAYESGQSKPHNSRLIKLAGALGVSDEYLRRDDIEDSSFGMEHQPYVDEIRREYGEKAAREIRFLMERNAALFAGGAIPQEAKDAYFESVMEAYLKCKEAARETYGKKNGSE